jgi:MADS-box transcription factor
MATSEKTSRQHEDKRDEQDDEDVEEESEEKKGRRKIEISFIENKSRRHITFSKRKAGIMKKVLSPS